MHHFEREEFSKLAFALLRSLSWAYLNHRSRNLSLLENSGKWLELAFNISKDQTLVEYNIYENTFYFLETTWIYAINSPLSIHEDKKLWVKLARWIHFLLFQVDSTYCWCIIFTSYKQNLKLKNWRVIGARIRHQLVLSTQHAAPHHIMVTFSLVICN